VIKFAGRLFYFLVGEPLRRFPLVGAAQSRVSDSPLPAEVGGDVCLWQTLAHSRNAHNG